MTSKSFFCQDPWHITLFIVGLFVMIIGIVAYLELADDRATLPECYLTTEAVCAEGYDAHAMPGYWSMIETMQCCREPHYVLQGIEPTLYSMTLLCNEVNRTAEMRWNQ